MEVFLQAGECRQGSAGGGSAVVTTVLQQRDDSRVNLSDSAVKFCSEIVLFCTGTGIL